MASAQQNTEDIVQCQAPGVLPSSCQLVHLNVRYLMFTEDDSSRSSKVLKLFPGSPVKLKVKSVKRAGGQQSKQLIVFTVEGEKEREGYLVVSLIDQVTFGSFNTAHTLYRVDTCNWKYFGCILIYQIDLRSRLNPSEDDTSLPFTKVI